MRFVHLSAHQTVGEPLGSTLRNKRPHGP
jgi:hypothetical protein